MRMLENISPKRVMAFFEDICGIPHGSGNTKAIGDYCINKAQQMGLTALKDAMGNVVIKKPASKGYEDHPAVVLQAHLDMVCERVENSSFDFEKSGIEIAVEGDYITANGTTLGGDDGIGMAMALAVLEDSSLKHPPIEALFTVDEETGMFGAAGLDAGLVSARRMINIDSEEEGVLTVSCAGGASVAISLALDKQKVNMPCYEVAVSGLLGGHSGVEIDKDRYNANILLGEFLKGVNAPYNIISIMGGSKENAIPAFATLKIATEYDLVGLAESFVSQKVKENEPDLKISVTKINNSNDGFSSAASQKITDLLYGLKNGVIKMSQSIKGLVQTSLNLGILRANDGQFTANISVRSSVNDEKISLINELKAYAAKIGATATDSGYYPAWEYLENSYLRQVMVDCFEQQFGKKPIVAAIHAGLECGLLSEKLNGLDAVSFGPDMVGIHTPNEKLSISSTQRSYKYLCKVLENL